MTDATPPLEASPSRPGLLLIGVVALLVTLVCALPVLLLIAGLLGARGLTPHLNSIFITAPALAVAVFFACVTAAIAGDLVLGRPVLTIGAAGVLDRRLADTPIAWTEVSAVTVLRGGSGGAVLELKSPREVRFSAYRVGAGFGRPRPGIVHVPLRLMTQPARRLADAILAHASQHGVDAGEAPGHPEMRPAWLFQIPS